MERSDQDTQIFRYVYEVKQHTYHSVHKWFTLTERGAKDSIMRVILMELEREMECSVEEARIIVDLVMDNDFENLLVTWKKFTGQNFEFHGTTEPFGDETQYIKDVQASLNRLKRKLAAE